MVLADNTVQSSARDGMLVIGSVTGALIRGNVISGVGTGFYCINLGPATGQSLIYDNSLTGEDNAYDGGTQNRWNVTKIAGTNVVGGSWIAGNYYSNNTGVDFNMDGICDSNYLIGLGKYDYLPLFLVDRPSAPRNLTATAGDGEVELTWEVPESDGGWPLIGYNLYRGTNPSNLVFYISLVEILEYTDTNVSNGKAYFYQVAGVNPEKVGVLSSMVMAMPASMPSAPNLVATPGDGYVNLTWAPPVSTGGGSIVSYNIYRGGAPIVILAKVAGNVLYYNDTSVTNRVTYSYQVSANNTAGEGLRSATAVAMPNWPASMPVINITAPTASFIKATTVEVTWDMSDSGSGVAYCEVRIDSQGWVNLSLGQSYTFNNLSQGPHMVEVRAINHAGFSNNATKGFTVDNVAPQVESTYPSGDAAPVTQNVTIEFNEDMEQATATIDGENMTVTIVGKEVRCAIPFDIVLDTTYMVMVSGSDLAGNQMASPYFFNFTTTDKVKVTGRVIDSDGKPVGGADVYIGVYSTTSDPEGNFTLYVPPGTYAITIEADGLDPYNDNVTVSSTGGNLGTFLTAGSQDEQDDTNWLMLIGGIAGLAAGVVLLVLVFRMMKKSKKEEGKPPAQ
jgi:fibronectin type 3 domain-containing protein